MLGMSLSSCRRYHPAEAVRSSQSDFDRPCCLRPSVEGSTFGIYSRGHLCVYSRYGPMTRGLPYGDRVGRLHELGFPLPCYPSYRALISTLAGLTPAEHASLDWTHNRAYGFPVPGSPGGSCHSHSDRFSCCIGLPLRKERHAPYSYPILRITRCQACLRPDNPVRQHRIECDWPTGPSLTHVVSLDSPTLIG